MPLVVSEMSTPAIPSADRTPAQLPSGLEPSTARQSQRPSPKPYHATVEIEDVALPAQGVPPQPVPGNDARNNARTLRVAEDEPSTKATPSRKEEPESNKSNTPNRRGSSTRVGDGGTEVVTTDTDDERAGGPRASRRQRKSGSRSGRSRRAEPQCGCAECIAAPQGGLDPSDTRQKRPTARPKVERGPDSRTESQQPYQNSQRDAEEVYVPDNHRGSQADNRVSQLPRISPESGADFVTQPGSQSFHLLPKERWIPTTDDPIVLVEAYTQAKEAKERELANAYRVLAYLDQGPSTTNPGSRSPRRQSRLSSRTYSVDYDFDLWDHRNPNLPRLTEIISRRCAELQANNFSARASLTGSLAANDDKGGPAQEVDTLRREVTVLTKRLQQKNIGWLSFSIRATYQQCKNRFRQGPRAGTQRLSWICECGEELFADLPVADASEYQKMLDFLNHSKPPTGTLNNGKATPSQIERGTVTANYTTPSPGPNSFSNGRSTTSPTSGSSSTYVSSTKSQIPASSSSGVLASTKYLELCVDVGKYETKLAEIQVTSNYVSGATICTDSHLFRKIHERYVDLRRRTWRRFFYRPAGMKFVHFGVQEGYRVSFFSSDPLPPEDAIATKRYECNMLPPIPPPMDSRTFLHYFYKHKAHSQSTCAKYVNRLPKKLGESLIRSLGVDELREGWGIHIIEGPNKVAICWALMIVLIVSFGVSLGYDLIARSGESGFAIGQWMVAALTVALSALYFSLEDEVNSTFD